MNRSFSRTLIRMALCAPLAASANDLLDTYHLAQQQDQTLLSASFQRDASIEAYPLARATLLPQLTGTVGADRIRLHTLEGGEAQTSGTGAGTTAIDTGADTFYYSDKTYSVNLSQAIFDWTAFKTLAQANSQVAAAEATYRSAEQSLIYRSADAYFNVLNAQDTLRADTDAKTSYEQQLNQAQKKFDVGLAAITDVRNAQASFDTSSATVIADKRLLDSSRRTLGQIVGRPVIAIQGLQEEIPLVSPNPIAEDDWVKAAMQDNPDLMTSYQNAEAARKNIGINRGKYLPTLDLQGSVGRQKENYLYQQDSITDSIGLAVNWNMFQGGRVRAEIHQAEASYKQSQAQFELERRTVDQGARDAYEGVMSGIASVNANRQAVLSNRTSLQASQVGLKVGTRTEVDVLTAQQALAAAERSYFQARYDYLRSVLSLKQQAGRLVENDLAEIDRLLVISSTAPRR